MRMPSGYFQEKADLKLGYLTGRYYNTQPKVAFHCPQELFTLHEMKNIRTPPYTNLDTHQDQMRLTKCKSSTPRVDNNQLDAMPGQNIERPFISQTPVQHKDRQIQDLDSTPKYK